MYVFIVKSHSTWITLSLQIDMIYFYYMWSLIEKQDVIHFDIYIYIMNTYNIYILYGYKSN